MFVNTIMKFCMQHLNYNLMGRKLLEQYRNFMFHYFLTPLLTINY